MEGQKCNFYQSSLLKIGIFFILRNFILYEQSLCKLSRNSFYPFEKLLPSTINFSLNVLIVISIQISHIEPKFPLSGNCKIYRIYLVWNPAYWLGENMNVQHVFPRSEDFCLARSRQIFVCLLLHHR